MRVSGTYLRLLAVACALSAIWLMSPAAYPAEFPEYRFHTMSETSYYGGIHSIAKDSTGRMWFSGFDALFMYDGTDFIRMDGKVSVIAPDENWSYGKIAVDGDGNLFVATNHALLQYSYENDDFIPLLKGRVTSLDVDDSGTLWMIHNGVVESLSKEGHRRWHFSPDMYISSRIMTIICSGDNVYLASDGFLYMLDTGTASYSQVTVIKERGCAVLDVLGHGDSLYVLTQMHGVYMFDGAGTLRKRFTVPGKWESAGMKEMYLDASGFIWVATQSGIMFIEPETGMSRLVRSDLYYAYSLPNNSVWSIYEDPDGGVWIGTYGGKLAYASPYDDGVDSFGATPGGLDHPIVSCFEEDGDGNLWIGTEGGGLNFWDRKKGKFTYYTAENGSGLVSNMIKRIRYSSDGSLVVSTFNGGVMKYDAGSGRFTDFGKFLPRIAYDFVWEGDAGVWMNDPDGDLVYADLQKGTSEEVHLKDRQGRNLRMNVETLFHDSEGNLCLVTHAGLFVVDVTDRKVLKHHFIENSSYNANNLCSYCVASNGDIWIGSRGGGVNLLASDGTYTNFRDNAGTGLEGKAVFGIIEDLSSRNIWFSTDDGFYCYDRESGCIGKSRVGSPSLNGAQYVRSCFRTSDGDLLFGGTDGFIRFSPGKVKTNAQKPKAFFTDLKVNSVETNFRKGGQIRLSHEQSNLEISFSSNSYLYAEKNQYAYRMTGVSDTWSVLPPGQKTVRFFNISPGNYRFEVKASNNDGVWGDYVSSLSFRIMPSPFLTWWACLIYISVLAGLLFIIILIRKKLDSTATELKELYDKKYIAGPSNIVVSSADDALLKKAMELVEHNIDNSDYDVDAFVADMAMGRTALYYKITELTGLSIKEFILDLRLKRASQLLKETELTVSEISYMTGFTNPKYFSTCFRRHFRQTPSECRSSSSRTDEQEQ